MACEKVLFKRLRERGFRLTPQREMVLSVMHQMNEFATAEEIYEQVQALSSAVDISTIYRTLDLFHDFHVVATIDPGDGHRRYRLSDVDGPQLHLFCRACGAVSGITVEQAQALVGRLEETTGFEAELDGLSIPGLCAACRGTEVGSEI